MDREFSRCENDSAEELSQGGDATRVKNQWEQVRTLQEISRWGARGSQELYRLQVRVRLQEVCRRSAETGEEICEWEETVTVQELCQWEEDGEQREEVREWQGGATALEASQWGRDARRQQEYKWEEDEESSEEDEGSSELSLETDGSFSEDSQWDDGQELSQRSDESSQDLSPWDEDEHSHTSQWEDSREPEWSQVRGSSDEELSEGAEDLGQELLQWDLVSCQELSQWGRDIGSKLWDRPLCLGSDREPRPCLPEGLSSASPLGTEVAAEAVPDLTSASPSLQSPLEDVPPAPAPSRADEEAGEGSLWEMTFHSDEEMRCCQIVEDLRPIALSDPELLQDVSEEYSEQDLSQGEVTSSGDPSGCTESVEQGLSQGDVVECEEVSSWEENSGPGASRGNGSSASGHSSWENDSHNELVQGNWEDEAQHGIVAFCPKDDKWHEVSILEPPPEEYQQSKWRLLAEDVLLLPVPREAWVEGPAVGPCSRGPVPAPHSPSSPRPAWLGAQALRRQPAAPRKRPSRFRRALRALRGLFCCPCMRPQPEE
ncbi:hypothetical protein HGM15179_003589 [Zosterops borbonicus]|uniref:Uncharacterized protein n=1 Tax=Zosterops borbonicus TaxID=364589 RepID=A0A8K1LRA7_9PASS|nr:hypothetical protein HGM15179_003589 [Zosterops borbonicus]